MSDRQWGLIEMMWTADLAHRLKISSVVNLLYEFEQDEVDERP